MIYLIFCLARKRALDNIVKYFKRIRLISIFNHFYGGCGFNAKIVPFGHANLLCIVPILTDVPKDKCFEFRNEYKG